MYRKPMMIAVEDLAEGVYAASGSGAAVTAQYLSDSTNDWTGETDTKFKVILTGNHAGHQKITLTFNGTFREGWGGNGSVICNGNVATLDVWDPQDTFEITLKGMTKGLSFVSGKIESVN